MEHNQGDYLADELDPRDLNLLNEVVDKILSKVTATSEFEIEVQIHDLILKNVKYVNKDHESEHTIEGALLNKKAVCEGIAKTVKYLLNRKSIKCELVIGKLNSDSNVLHAWNLVFIEEHWYHLDVTADLGMSQNLPYRYDYFNLSDEEISKDHVILDSPYACNVSKNDYYYRMGLVIYTQDDFQKLLAKRLRKRQTILTFKLPSTKDPKKVEEKIFDNAFAAMQKSIWPYRKVRLYPNLDQLVFSIEVK